MDEIKHYNSFFNRQVLTSQFDHSFLAPYIQLAYRKVSISEATACLPTFIDILTYIEYLSCRILDSNLIFSLVAAKVFKEGSDIFTFCC